MFKYAATLVLLLATTCMALDSDVDMVDAKSEFEDEEFSQASIIPSDNEEISLLEGKNRIFTDFCIRSRDLVIGDIKRTTNGLTSNLFTLFFKSAEDVGLEALADVREFATKMTIELRVAPRAEEIINAEQKTIEESDDKPKSVIDAVGRTIAAFGSAVSAKVVKKLEAVKSAFGVGEVFGAMVKSCDKIAEYNENLRKLFGETLEEISEMDAKMANVKIESVNCITSKRLLKINGLCRIVRLTKSPFVKMLLNIRDATYQYDYDYN